ncbi:MAG: DUF561 domain-containing protein [bacterium]|nr:DUF561 domain-containing protein [bacterium]
MPPPSILQEHLQIEIPIVQAGMVWTSGWRLAAAVSQAGALGIIGAGSMKPELLREHIRKTKVATSKPFGVNIPLLRGDAPELLKTTIDEGVRIVFTSAGNPKTYTPELKQAGCFVVHVVPSVKFAQKAEAAGVDAIVAEGTEAGGHNGVDEIATLPLIPQVVDAVKIPVIAAGGIADGRGIAAALCLGAAGVQIGTRFAATVEASCHENFKQAILQAGDNATTLTLRKIGNARVIWNEWALRAVTAEKAGAEPEELKRILGEKRERLGIFEGDIQEGQLEAGQGSGLIHDIPSAAELVHRLWQETQSVLKNLT